MINDMSHFSPHELAANTIRTLAMDGVQQANSGHPGAPMGLADVAVVLWHQFLRHNPAGPHWANRDRFVLSNGHASMLLYSLLHLSGYDVSLNDLQQFRQWGSLTPGHPEHAHTPGVETTTGPLGQGIGNAVGMALAGRWLAANFNRPGYDLFTYRVYAIAGDGDLMEGVSHEVAALAGHLKLGNLVVFYDDNQITIDGATSLAWSEDVPARFRAYGWQTQRIDGHDPAAIAAAIEAAQAAPDRPWLIACRTHIGYGSPHRQDTAKAHGEPLGEAEIVLTKERLGWPPEAKFFVPDAVYGYLRPAGGTSQHTAWRQLLADYSAAYPEEAAALQNILQGRFPAGWDDTLPEFVPGSAMATRVASGQVLDALAPRLPALLGGSADLTGSNKTQARGTAAITPDDFTGRYLHYGIREHGMGSIMNGLALSGLRPYGGTFLVFSDYMRPPMRLAAMMGLPVTYVFTHDSIGLGEDGPTHQPVEQLMGLRTLPNLYVFRPAEATETAAGWRVALCRTDGPTALVLTRQNLPVLEVAETAGALQGGYVLRDPAGGPPEVILMGTGSEVHIALAAQALLADQGVLARVVSLPCWELFAAQPQAYRDSVLPPEITARVAIEAGVTLGWERWLGPAGVAIGLNHFGASAPYETLYEKFGLTPEAVAAAARQLRR